MADGAATLTLILTHLWADAGNPSGGETIDIQVPPWLKPDYTQQQFSSEMFVDDDCQ
jgi:hypothetical protein